MSKFLTVVFNVEDWHPDQIAGLNYHPDVKMISWIDVVQERDYFKKLCEINEISYDNSNSNAENIFYENQATLNFRKNKN